MAFRIVSGTSGGGPCNCTHLSCGLAGVSSLKGSSVKGGEITLASPLSWVATGLSNESGLEVGSANRGDAF